MENHQEVESEEEDGVAEEEEEEEIGVVGSSLTLEKVAAAKQYIENHYKAQKKHIQERKERFDRFLIWFDFMGSVNTCNDFESLYPFVQHVVIMILIMFFIFDAFWEMGLLGITDLNDIEHKLSWLCLSYTYEPMIIL